jgi:hypothetical protein
MKISSYHIFLSIFIILLFYSLCQAKYVSGPGIYLEEPVFDAKEIKASEYIEHTFKVFNKGDSSLKITNVKTSCGCTAVSFDKTVSPGGEGKITLKIKIKGISGQINKTATVYSNDPNSQGEVLTVKASIRESIMLSPRRVRFKGEEGTVQTQSVEITAQEDKPLTLQAGDFTLKDKINYKIEEVKKGKVFRISFTNLPMQAGRQSGSLELKTNYSEDPVITIRVNCNFTTHEGSQ